MAALSDSSHLNICHSGCSFNQSGKFVKKFGITKMHGNKMWYSCSISGPSLLLFRPFFLPTIQSLPSTLLIDCMWEKFETFAFGASLLPRWKSGLGEQPSNFLVPELKFWFPQPQTDFFVIWSSFLASRTKEAWDLERSRNIVFKSKFFLFLPISAANSPDTGLVTCLSWAYSQRAVSYLN